MPAPYRVARISDIKPPVTPEPGSFEWKPIRHHFNVRSFGVNAMVAAAAGDWVVEEHTETQGNAAQHEELYLVVQGRARFQIDGQQVEAPAGTLVFVPDPASLRSARALEAGTTVLAVGGKPGEAYRVSAWEKKYFQD